MIRRVWWAESPSNVMNVDARDDRHAIRLAGKSVRGFRDREVREVTVETAGGSRRSTYLVALDRDGNPCGEISALGSEKITHEYLACERCESTFRVVKGSPLPEHKRRRGIYDVIPCVPEESTGN